MWSLGVAAFEIACGKAPFPYVDDKNASNTKNNKITNFLAGTRQPCDEIETNNELEQFIRDTLKVDAALRE